MKSKDQVLLEEAYRLIVENSEEESLLNQYEFGNLTQRSNDRSMFTIDIRKKETGATATVKLYDMSPGGFILDFHGVEKCNGFDSDSECQEEFERLFKVISRPNLVDKLLDKPVKYIPAPEIKEKPMETRACTKCGFMIPRDSHRSGWPYECPSCGSSTMLWHEVTPEYAKKNHVQYMSR